MGVGEALGRDRRPGAQIAEPRERGVVPQHTPAAARDEERNDDRAVVLPEIEVVALEIEEPDLVFAEPVQRLALGGRPLLPHVLRVLAHHDSRHDRPAALLEQRRAARVEERDPAARQIDARFELRRGERRGAARLGEVERRALALLRLRGQALADEERLVLRVGDAHNVGGADLQLQEPVAETHHHTVGHALNGRRGAGTGGPLTGALRTGAPDDSGKQHDQANDSTHGSLLEGRR